MTRYGAFKGSSIGMAIGIACAVGLGGFGCSKSGDGTKLQELSAKLATATEDYERSQTSLKACQTKVDEYAAKAPADSNSVVVRVEGDVLTLAEAQSSSGGPAPANISSQDAQRVYAAAVKVIRDHRAELQSCYNRALKQDSSIQNRTLKADIEFTVEPSGALGSPNVTPKIGKSFNQCATDSMKGWKFTPFAGKSMRVSAPITLVSSDK